MYLRDVLPLIVLHLLYVKALIGNSSDKEMLRYREERKTNQRNIPVLRTIPPSEIAYGIQVIGPLSTSPKGQLAHAALFKKLLD